MALRNTSERYEYIYGSNVRKLETDMAGKQTAKAVPAKKNVRRPNKEERGIKQQIQKQRQLFRRMRRSFLHLTGSIRW